MKSLIFSLLIITSLSSCGVFNKTQGINGGHTINFKATVLMPYCGGVQPTYDVGKGYYENMKGVAFDVYKGSAYIENNTKLFTLQLNDEGKANFKVEAGTYYLVRADKAKSTDEFIKNNSPMNTVHFKVLDKACFEKWQKTADFVFTVTGNDELEYVEKGACEIGTNPCIEYIGPKKP